VFAHRHAVNLEHFAHARGRRGGTLQRVEASAENQILADTGGLVVTDDGRRVLVIDRGTGGLVILAFVLGVLTLVAAGFGLVGLFGGVPSRTLGAIFVAVSLVLAVVTFVVARKFRRDRGRPLHECRPVTVLDRKLGLFSHRCAALVQFDQVRFARKYQIGSSSPKLVAVTPGGTKVLKRGSPFDGGVGNLDEVLTSIAQGAV
jgi:hypothetical protein